MKGQALPTMSPNLPKVRPRHTGGWRKGHKRSATTKEKIRATLRTRCGPGSKIWKGDMASYSAIHKWVRRHWGAPMKCGFCGETDGKLEWCNLDKRYGRDRKDWIEACVSCHRRYDMGTLANKGKMVDWSAAGEGSEERLKRAYMERTGDGSEESVGAEAEA